jgi:hypothetical protein
MLVEAEFQIEADNSSHEYFIEEKFYLVIALIEETNENGSILLRLNENDSLWTDSNSSFIHPCGFWNFILANDHNLSSHRIKQLNLSDDMKMYLIANSPYSKFNWESFFKRNTNVCPAPFEIFNQDQLDGMDKQHHPSNFRIPNFLSCDFSYNPRFIWNSLKNLNSNDISNIYRRIGIIKKELSKETDLKMPSALVLMPKLMESSFFKYPNMISTHMISNLNVSCVHREEIKMIFDVKVLISNNYPHLLQAESLDLLDKRIKLEPIFMFIILCSSFDLSNSQVKFCF